MRAAVCALRRSGDQAAQVPAPTLAKAHWPNHYFPPNARRNTHRCLMSLTLYAHPFSSYCQKVLVALYENDVEFEYRTLEDPSAMAELKARWPFARFPILVDDGRTIVESTIIIEHLMLRHGVRVRWLPEDPLEALEVRFLDRFFDNDVALEPCGLRGSAVALLCRLGSSHCRCLSDVEGVSVTPPRLACIRASRRRGETVPLVLSAGSAGPGLKP